MRIVMFGTGPFAVPTFQSLLESSHKVLCLVTRPIQDSGKRRKSAENPMRDVAEARGVTVFDPASCNEPVFVEQLQEMKADLFVVCDYGQILSADCLAVTSRGGINLHGSLLPRYRGASPINWAIFHGESILGVSVIHMTPRLDGGPVLCQASLEVDPEQTAADVEPKLAELGVNAVGQAIDMLQSWDGSSVVGKKQNPQEATRAPRLKKSDGEIDWSRSACQIVNQIRAFQPWPGTFTHSNAPHLKQPLRLIVHQAEVVDSTEVSASDARPGTVLASDGGRLWIQTGEGVLELLRVQPAGKKPMPIADFLRGNPLPVGDQF